MKKKQVLSFRAQRSNLKRSPRLPRRRTMTSGRLVSHSEAETMRLASDFAKTLRGGEVVLLEGDLGSGKTTFVRGLARALGIRKPIRSPTFTLMHIHDFKSQISNLKRLIHIDAYRLRGAADLRALGIEEYAGKKDTVVLIEWGEKVRSLFPRALQFRFTHKKAGTRHIMYVSR